MATYPRGKFKEVKVIPLDRAVAVGIPPLRQAAGSLYVRLRTRKNPSQKGVFWLVGISKKIAGIQQKIFCHFKVKVYLCRNNSKEKIMNTISMPQNTDFLFPFLYGKIEGLPIEMQKEVFLFADFLLSKASHKQRQNSVL
jgi:hypothetical protein